jgi:DEAD/DEAH box helicase domain-containing protein
VGFNILKFDYTVLSSYTSFNLKKLPTFDILLDIHNHLGFRISLSELAEKNLNQKKLGNGLDSILWVKQGRFDLVEEYCRRDVELTRDLFFFGLENHILRFENNGQLLELTLDWNLEKILEKVKRNK